MGAPRGPAATAGLGARAPGVGHGSRRGAPVGGTLGVLVGGVEPLVTPLPRQQKQNSPPGAGPWVRQ